MTVFGGALYVGTSNDTIGGQLWRSQNGTTWIPVGAPGMGDSNNIKPEGVIVFGGQLYVFETTVHRYRGVALAGWDHTGRRSTRMGSGIAAMSSRCGQAAWLSFRGRLTVGTANWMATALAKCGGC